MLVESVVKAAIPSASEGLIDHIVWGRTSYPGGNVCARTLYKAASRFDRAIKKGLTLCDFCDNIARPGKFVCAQCVPDPVNK